VRPATGGRRGLGEDFIYWGLSKNRYVGAVSQGFSPGGRRIRRKVTGRTKAEVRDKLRELHLAAGHLWQDHSLVLASTIGTPLDDHNVRRQFRKISESAGVDASWQFFHVIDDQVSALHEDVARVRAHPLIPASVAVGGFLYDVDTGLIERLV